MMTYSVDFREKVLSIKASENLTYEEASIRFKVGKASIMRWSKKIAPQRTRYKPATKIDMEALKRDVEEYPDAYLSERAERLGVSRVGVFHALRRLKVTYKKKPSASQGGSREKVYFLPNDRKA